MGRVLIIDDDETVCELLQFLVVESGHEVQSCHVLQEGVEAARHGGFDVIFLDIFLPDGSGIEYVQDFQNFPNSPEIVVITGSSSFESVELAIKSGAWDYLQKPLSLKKVQLAIKRVMEYRKQLNKNKRSPRLLKRVDIIGSSTPLQTALERLAQAASFEMNVLLNGETGTGKELFARALHENSERAGEAFVVVDCASLPETLIESALFGHIKGSFTGADSDVEGLIKKADGGTLFLDEIGELCLMLQKSLLRVLQEKTYRPIGANSELQSDFRLIAATNRDLHTMVAEGTFREDLLFRLNSYVISIPPLRERADDIEALAIHYIFDLSKKYKLDVKGISPEYLEALKEYQWPGNVRELINIIEQSIIQSESSPILYPKHLPQHVRLELLADEPQKNAEMNQMSEDATFDEDMDGSGVLPTLREFRDTAMKRIERKYLELLMVQSDGSIKKALATAGIGRTRLYNLLKKYDIR